VAIALYAGGALGKPDLWLPAREERAMPRQSATRLLVGGTVAGSLFLAQRAEAGKAGPRRSTGAG
jgi:hypothetical protein